MSTPGVEVQWRQNANGVWEYLASDGQWYAADPARGTPIPPDGGASAQAPPGAAQAPYGAAPTYTPPGYVYTPGYVPPTMTCPRCATMYDPNRRACPNCGALTGAPQMELTSAGTRFGQYLLDVVLAIVTLFIGYLIWSLFIWDRGQTPAMQILHIRAVNKDDLQRTSMGTMALREVVGRWLVMGAIAAIFFPAWIILCFMILWDDDRQELWDKIADTIVVNGDPPPDVPVQAQMGAPSFVAPAGPEPTGPQFTTPGAQPADSTGPTPSAPSGGEGGGSTGPEATGSTGTETPGPTS